MFIYFNYQFNSYTLKFDVPPSRMKCPTYLLWYCSDKKIRTKELNEEERRTTVNKHIKKFIIQSTYHFTIFFVNTVRLRCIFFDN